ncbi:MAG: restriction endonuclease subunit S [Candidatus Melainabacteria bacterium]|nr:restriction endonuclease subunit S [Candidatus Melainabacteria bacterium]
MTNGNLPVTWQLTTLGEVLDYGRTEKAEPSELSPDSWVLELEDIEKDTSKLVQRLTYKQRQSKSTKNKFGTGDILYGKLRPYLNKVIIAPEPGYCSTEIVPLKPPKDIDGRYLFYWLKHPHFLSYVDAVSHGINMPRLGTEAGKNAPFVLAPFNEQKRIADKLDNLFKRVDACLVRLETVPSILERLRTSILRSAVNGSLTKNWRVAQNVTDVWTSDYLSEVAASRLGKMLDRNKNVGIPNKYLRNINVRWFSFDFSDIQEIRINERESELLALKEGDVLVCEGGEPGRCAVWHDRGEHFVYQKALHRVRVGDRLCPEWLTFCLKDAANSGALAALFTGTTIKHLTGVSLAKFRLPLPSVTEQLEIVRRVNRLMAFLDSIEERVSMGMSLGQQLINSMLARAFRGELLPQDPNDEPAKILLERIKSQQTSPKENNRSSKRKNKESADMQRKLIDVLTEAGDWISAEEAFRLCGIADGAQTDQIEALYAELRALDKDGRLSVKPIVDAQGVKQQDELKLLV